MFTAENEDVLVVFQSLCKQYPHENPVALWEMAGGQVAAEQRNGADLPQQTCPSCAGKGERYINRYYPEECDVCFGTGHV